MRNRTWMSLVLGCSVAVNLGCGWFGESQPTGGVAVVDLDEIAKQLGADDEIADALKSREGNLNSQLQVMRASYVRQLKERKEMYGEAPTDEQSQQLNSINRQINLNLVNAQQKAATHLTSHRAELIMEFREKVGPAAEEIAKARGLSIVVPKNEGWLLAVDERVDITDEVAAALKTNWTPIVSAAPAATIPAHAAQPRIAAAVEETNPQSPATNVSPSGVLPAAHLEPQPPYPNTP